MKKFLIIVVVFFAIVLGIVDFYIINANKEEVINKSIEDLGIILVNDLNTNFLSEVKVSDFFLENKYELEDYNIDTTHVGEKEIEFVVKLNDKMKAKSSFKVNIVDNVKPLIWLGSSYTVYVGASNDFYKDIICVDDYDEDIDVELLGEYETDKEGKYYLTLKATDKSGNESTQDFTLYVEEYQDRDYSYEEVTPVYYTDIVNRYKKDNTMIGVDMSSWQGDADFEKMKEAGVEFVILRVGSEDKNDERFLDSKFEEYINEANRLDILVGVYFYSYADSIDKAREDAKWILKQIKGKKVDLPIAFDWENWSTFNNYHLSLYKLSQMAKAYLDVFKEEGYEGMLYSSKTYLENFWMDIDYPVWLAHYTDETSYKGDFDFWQLTESGRVDGIYGDVDIDIRYLN